MTPEHCLRQRFSALIAGDYAAVFASYHDAAPFRSQFRVAQDYIRFARRQLAAIDVKSWECRALRSLDRERVECLLVVELAIRGSVQYFYELALLYRTAGGWKYHSAQKLGADEYHGDPACINFSHFDQAPEKVRF